MLCGCNCLGRPRRLSRWVKALTSLQLGKATRLHLCSDGGMRCSKKKLCPLTASWPSERSERRSCHQQLFMEKKTARNQPSRLNSQHIQCLAKVFGPLNIATFCHISGFYDPRLQLHGSSWGMQRSGPSCKQYSVCRITRCMVRTQ